MNRAYIPAGVNCDCNHLDLEFFYSPISANLPTQRIFRHAGLRPLPILTQGKQPSSTDSIHPTHPLRLLCRNKILLKLTMTVCHLINS